MSTTILQLVTQRQYRGAEVFAASLSGQLLEKGHQIIFAGLYPTHANLLHVEGAKNLDLDGSKKFIDLKLLWRLIRLIRQEKPDLIQANGSDTLKYAVWAKLFCPSVKITYRNISMVSSWVRKGSFRHRFNKWLMNRVDFVTSVGHESMNDLIRTYDYPPEKTKVIKRGVPVLCFDKKTEKAKLAHEFGFQFDDVLLLHVGQFSPEKNHRFLLDAFNLLSKRIDNIHLLLVGEGKLYSETKQWVSDNSLAGKIHFAGYRNPVQQIMAGADLFLLSSLIEGVPGVIIEAGMQKLPAVAIEVGGVGEVVIKDQTGVLIPTHDLNTFAAQAEKLIRDKVLRLRLGNAAYELATSNYSLEKCAADFENLYLSLLKQKR